MSLIRKPSEIVINEKLTILLYGQAGVGKSTLALSGVKPILYVDCDGSVGRVNSFFHSDTIQVTSWGDMNALLREDLTPYRTIVIDTVGRMIDLIQKDILDRTGKPKMTLQLFGDQKKMFSDYIKQLQFLGKNIIFVAHDRESVQDNGNVQHRPDISDKNTALVMRDCDLCGFLHYDGYKRIIEWNSSDSFVAKNTCYLRSPEDLPIVVDNNGNASGNNDYITRVSNQYFSFLKENKSLKNDYDKLLKEQYDEIEAYTTPKDINAKIKTYKDGIKHIWDSAVQIRTYIVARANELELVFDKEKGEYVNAPKTAPKKEGKKDEKNA